MGKIVDIKIADKTAIKDSMITLIKKFKKHKTQTFYERNIYQKELRILTSEGKIKENIDNKIVADDGTVFVEYEWIGGKYD